MVQAEAITALSKARDEKYRDKGSSRFRSGRNEGLEEDPARFFFSLGKMQRKHYDVSTIGNYCWLTTG